MVGYLDDLSDLSILIFIESDVDKRSKLYKEMNKRHRCVEFKELDDASLMKWLAGICAGEGVRIENAAAAKIIQTSGHSMNLLNTEIQKLISYKKDKKVIDINDVVKLVTPSLETKVFDILDAVGTKNASKAVETYNQLIAMKQSPFAILAMMSRQFRILFELNELLANGENRNVVAEKLGIRSFLLSGYIKQSKMFKRNELISAIKGCLDVDISAKSGKISDETGVLLLIVKYANHANC